MDPETTANPSEANPKTDVPAKKTRRELAVMFHDCKDSKEREALAVQYPELKEMFSAGCF